MPDVARELEALYGSAEPPRPGVLHVVLAARAADGRLSVLRIGAPSTPRSESDFFVVNATRAHADAIVTSAENLRREPQLNHALQGPWASALAQYRREVLHKSAPLTVAILTRTGDLPCPHPFWSDGTTKLVMTPAGTSSQARELATPDPVHFLAVPNLDVVSAARSLHARGLPLVSVEAGPRTASALYDAQVVSELWLTRWESVTRDAEFAGALPDDALLFRGLTLLGSARRREGGHDLRFERWARAAPAAGHSERAP